MTGHATSAVSALFAIFFLATTTVFASATDLTKAVSFTTEMIVTPDPLATAAGEEILKQGGSAADAMITAQAVLGLTNPQASGLGGGAFVVYHDAETGTTTTIDAREKAPALATSDRFAGLSFVPAWQSGLSVGVPGTPHLMEYMSKKHGRMEWGDLFQSAIDLARGGFPLSEQTSNMAGRVLQFNPSCDDDGRIIFRDPTAFAYFSHPNCTAKAAGTMITNEEYANTLEAMVRNGSGAFYEGEIGSNIVAAVKNDKTASGDMTMEDLANYNVIERPPVCKMYRGHNVCGMGPPSSGGLGVGQILGILENFDVGVTGKPLDVNTVHLFTQAGRLAFADRGLYVADSDFVTVPVEGMLDNDYLVSRADLISDMDMGLAEPGVPPGAFDPSAPDANAKGTGTTHVSIVDRYGNALSMTSSIEAPFGNSVMVNGFLLNNQLTDFSFTATDPNTNLTVANRVEGNKRPRSSMSPTIVFDEQGRVEIVSGSAGGSLIIGHTAQSVMNIVDFELDAQEAINVPHFSNRNGVTEIEAPSTGITLDYDAEAMASALKERGHSDPTIPVENRTVNIGPATSGLSTIQILRGSGDGISDKISLKGGVDPRRGGTVGGSNTMIEPEDGTALSSAPSKSNSDSSPTGAPVVSSKPTTGSSSGSTIFAPGGFLMLVALTLSYRCS